MSTIRYLYTFSIVDVSKLTALHLEELQIAVDSVFRRVNKWTFLAKPYDLSSTQEVQSGMAPEEVIRELHKKLFYCGRKEYRILLYASKCTIEPAGEHILDPGVTAVVAREKGWKRRRLK